jgi:acyl-coenzyme A synthetase/AMP-(fatty) acid ligase
MKRMILTTKDGIAYKVFPNMTEEILDLHEAVIQSCIVGAADGDDQVLRAYIMLSVKEYENRDQVERKLRGLCEEKLPSYARPTFYEFSDQLPLTAAGKVDYRMLEEMSANKNKA